MDTGGQSRTINSEESVSALRPRLNESTSPPLPSPVTPKSNNQHPIGLDESPQDLSKCALAYRSTSPKQAAQDKLSPAAIDKMIVSPSFVDNFSLQNLHLAHLAFYQQNPFYYQNLYPFLSSQGIPINPADMLQAHLDQQQAQQQAQQLHQQQTILSVGSLTPSAGTVPSQSFISNSSSPYDLKGISAEMLAAVASSAAATAAQKNTNIASTTTTVTAKRKLLTVDNEGTCSYSQQKNKIPKSNKLSNFKIFKDEPIPQGYLKFRFNEDCNFANCGYRNHQSHFHCCRNDCFYSFCDKTRFVQHTARHERLDKLMGDDFKQYRANMRCGYDECVYNKNMGKCVFSFINYS